MTATTLSHNRTIYAIAVIAGAGALVTLTTTLQPATACALQAAISLVTAVACVRAARRGTAFDFWPWLLFGTGQLLEASSALAAVIGGTDGFGGISNVLATAAIGAGVVGLAAVCLPSRRSPFLSRIALDLLVVLGTGFVVAWTWDLTSLLGLPSPSSPMAGLADFLGLVVGAIGVALLPWSLRSRRGADGARVRMVSIALLVTTLGDAGLFTTTLATSTTSAATLLASIITLVAATMLPASMRGAGHRARGATLDERRFLDLATLAVASMVVVFVLTGETLDDVTKPAMLVLVLGLVARHFHNAHANLTLAAKLAESERYHTDLIRSSRDVIVVVRADGRIGYANPAASTLFDIPDQQLRGLEVSALLRPVVTTDPLGAAMPSAADPGQDLDRPEFEITRADGKTRLVEALISPAPDGTVYALRDVTERAEMMQRIGEAARRDPLTGLANRFGFEEALAERLRSGAAAALVLCDLDGFKQVNDTSGHGAGDEILRQVGHRLAVSLPGTFVARFGGDEFAVLLPADISRNWAIMLAEHVQTAVSHRYDVVGKEVEVPLTIGLAFAREISVAEALRNADLALYEAKGSGRGQLRVFEQSMLDRAIERIELEEHLRRTLDDGALTLRFQPIFDTETGRIASAEVLVRWIVDGAEVLQAKDLIELAERSGCVSRLGEWVLGAAIAQVAAWQREGFVIPVAVNVSAPQLLRGDLAGTVRSMLAQAGVDPGLLTLEITESVFLDDVEGAIETLAGLRALGVRIAIDDFGTGYSCFAYLSRIPVDVLKIARLFVDGIADCPTRRVLVRTMTMMSRELGLAVTAEGVETDGQLAVLRQVGVDHIQGFLVARPMSADELTSRAAARGWGVSSHAAPTIADSAVSTMIPRSRPRPA